MELFKAHRQWAERPADERFSDLPTLYSATKKYASQAGTKEIPYSDVRVQAVDDDVQLVGRANVPATFTNWAFGQLCRMVQAPAEYLQRIPATLAAQNLNYGLANKPPEGKGQLLFHTNGGLLLRAFTSDKYTRIWNYEVADRMLTLADKGWQPARPDFNSSPDDFPALYASDHDMFAFLCNSNITISEPGNPDSLKRGVIVENSEVGAAALKLTRFLYRAMCGNHIIWGATQVTDISIRHVGEAREKWGLWATEIRRYAEESASDEEAKIARAKSRMIAATKEEVLDKLFGLRSLNLTHKVIEAGYDAVLPAQDGDPRTPWGITQGITRHSQTIPFTDQRNNIDRAAGKILEINF
jgi:hypothetical protein